ncbi:MAG: Mur ligase domain-containing protein, partial [Candidatus Gracilibacteria bacterium]|nr:Mur ligase domain-containing protein [Candidatus Gracilibacteria bacterium]
MKLLEAKNIHFVGIGGIGNSALAQLLHSKNKKITGSDMCSSGIISALRR